MNSFVPTNNPSFTSQEHWDSESEPSTKAPKSLARQVAKSHVGRAMQEHAETVRDQLEDVTQQDYERIESPDRSRVASYFESGELQITSEGAFEIDSETDKETLVQMKESLMDLPLSPENRQEMRKLITKVDEAITRQEVQEAPQRIAESLEELKNTRPAIDRAKQAIREAKGISDRNVRKQVLDAEYSKLRGLNERQLFIAFALLENLERLRAANPDKMAELADEFQTSGKPAGLYKSVLINFVGTHNSFGFSKEVTDGLKNTAEHHERRGYCSRNGGPTYVQALLAAYEAPKKADDPYTFLQQTTRIPEPLFKKIVLSHLNQN